MRSNLLRNAAVGLVALASAGLACAADKPLSFSKLDRNQDNRVSMVEAQADDEVRAAFASADRNADGYLSQQEYFDWRNGNNAAPRSAPSREPPAPPAPSRQPVPPTPDAGDPTGQ